MKTCQRCHDPKGLDEFNKSSKNADGLQSYCRDCQRAWYGSNKTVHIANAKRRKKAWVESTTLWIWDYLHTHPCVDCGEADPVVLEFDHVRGNKLMNIAAMRSGAYSRKRLEDEIAKCEVRCANCHRRRTAISQNWYAFVAQR